MSVLSCSRKECDGIMCQTYVDSVGYICRECKKEFKNYLSSQKDILADSHGSILRALKNFIETRKGDFNRGSEVDTDEFFRKYTQE